MAKNLHEKGDAEFNKALSTAFCSSFRQALKKSGLTVDRAASRLGVTRETVIRYLRGKQTPRRKIMARISLTFPGIKMVYASLAVDAPAGPRIPSIPPAAPKPPVVPTAPAATATQPPPQTGAPTYPPGTVFNMSGRLYTRKGAYDLWLDLKRKAVSLRNAASGLEAQSNDIVLALAKG